jgi:flavin reductase (DIM6/NTAB) family NADH-FMN oxidoreductase RutF
MQIFKKSGTNVPTLNYVLTVNGDEGLIAATVNWFTQTPFESPLIAVVLKPDCYSYASVE